MDAQEGDGRGQMKLELANVVGALQGLEGAGEFTGEGVAVAGCHGLLDALLFGGEQSQHGRRALRCGELGLKLHFDACELVLHRLRDKAGAERHHRPGDGDR